MKICNVVISNFYKEGYGYQENILPKKQQQNGNDVCIITHYPNGREAPCEYVNDRGVRVIVLKEKKSILRRIPIIVASIDRSIGLYGALLKEKPDIIFAHGIYVHDYRWIIKYKNYHPSVKVFVDSHADYYNNPFYNTTKAKLTRFLFSLPLLRKLTPLTEMFWGVTPWRVKFLQEIYKIPAEKTDLLVMGGDEGLIDWGNRDLIRTEIRKKYKIPQDAFLVVAGGKIDKAKNFDKLIDAVISLDNPNVKLVLFGNIEDDMKAYIANLSNQRILLLGWISSDDVYPLFLSSDLGFFPGTHSVLWEQACSCGLPCVFKDWDGGFNHVDRQGNCIFLKNPTVESISIVLHELLNNDAKYAEMKRIASSEARLYFAYDEIAKRSILLESK